MTDEDAGKLGLTAWRNSSRTYRSRSGPMGSRSARDVGDGGYPRSDQHAVRQHHRVCIACFMGAACHRFIPSAVKAIVSRSVRHLVHSLPGGDKSGHAGLVRIQSYVAELTGMEAGDSSNYDAAALESGHLCHRVNGRRSSSFPLSATWKACCNYIKAWAWRSWIMRTTLRPERLTWTI